MLHILWMLLKIIGIIILVILGLILFVLGVVFLVPLKYCGSAEVHKEITKSTANMKFSWLLHLVSGKVDYADKQLTYEIRILGKKLELDKGDEEKPEEPQEKVQSHSEGDYENELAEEIPVDVINDVTEEVSKKETKSERKAEKRTKTKKESFFKKIKYTFKNICDKIKVLKQKKQEVEEFLKNEAHKAAFRKLWKEIGKLLKALKPKKLIINAHFGFEDPSITGKILAALSMLYPFYGDNVRIEPDFENAIIEGDFYLKGKIRIIYAVRLAWNLVWNKNVRVTLKDILKWIK